MIRRELTVLKKRLMENEVFYHPVYYYTRVRCYTYIQLKLRNVIQGAVSYITLAFSNICILPIYLPLFSGSWLTKKQFFS